VLPQPRRPFPSVVAVDESPSTESGPPPPIGVAGPAPSCFRGRSSWWRP
jgi:hypothetical protein